MAAPNLDKGFVSALHDALAADIDPGAGRHLAVHHQALAIELVEMAPGRPMRHEIGIGDQHARGIGMRVEHADRLARLHQQGFVGFQTTQAGDNAIEAVPVARRPADPAIDHELVRLFRHVRIEIVHQHAQRRFGQPAFGRDGGAAGGAHDALIIETVCAHLTRSKARSAAQPVRSCRAAEVRLPIRVPAIRLTISRTAVKAVMPLTSSAG